MGDNWYKFRDKLIRHAKKEVFDDVERVIRVWRHRPDVFVEKPKCNILDRKINELKKEKHLMEEE